MRNAYRSIRDVWDSPWGNISPNAAQKQKTDRVLRSTKLEDSIYADLRGGDDAMDALETEAKEKLSTFPALSRDVFQSFYSLLPKRNEEEMLSCTAQIFNSKILDHVVNGEDYPTIKSICEGRELPAYEAASEFTTRTAGELDALLKDFGGEKGAFGTLEKLQRAQDAAAAELAGLLERLRASGERNATMEQAAVDAANKAESKRQQVEAVSKLVDAAAARQKEDIGAILSRSSKAAAEKAEEVQSIIGAWSDGPGNMERSPVNMALLEHVRGNPMLRDISRYLGRFREIFAQRKKNGYAYGRGEKYSLELGNDLSRAITSELAMLAAPETAPLFLRKYQRKQIKQYQRREPIYKGAGDIICCLDESGSTAGDAAAWGKAVALTLLEIAADSARSFALIHFSGIGSCKVDVFLPGEYGIEEKTAAAETFLDGGTDFETPLRTAVDLVETGGFENADIVFITDGYCELPEAFAEDFARKQSELAFKVTGVLLDTDIGAGDFSLQPFCQTIYRTSEMFRDDIVQELINQRT
jgi:uncharacterized protein with von Willebrand factor type A (vWA) domain